jgi:Holliday junction resolvase RusA-like endonuclease
VTAAARARVAGMRPIAGDIALAVDVYRPARRGDLDNCLKVMIDSLKGVAFVDDSQVVHITARRFEDKANPRAVVTVSQSLSPPAVARPG